MPSLVLVVPGPIDSLTGGYIYDRHIVDGLRQRGWSVDVRELDESFPSPTPAALDQASRVIAGLPDRSDVVIDGLACGAMPAIVERECARLTIVALVHHPLAAETGIGRDRAAALEASERRSLAGVRLVVVTSRATAAALAAYDVAPSRVAVVEPGTSRAPLARGSQGARLQMLTVATLTPRKGHDILFRALSTIAHLDWHLTCVGDGDRDPATAARLRAQIATAGLEARVSFAGEAEGSALAAHYDHADLFVLPTYYEGYGMAVAEALARGLPVVSTPTGAISDLVGEEAGILVPAGDPPALAVALTRVMTEGGTRQRLRDGARRVRDRLPTWDDASARMAEALGRAAGSRV